MIIKSRLYNNNNIKYKYLWLLKQDYIMIIFRTVCNEYPLSYHYIYNICGVNWTKIYITNICLR